MQISNNFKSLFLSVTLLSGVICSTMHVDQEYRKHSSTILDIEQSWVENHHYCPLCAVSLNYEETESDLYQVIQLRAEVIAILAIDYTFSRENPVNNSRAPPHYIS